MNFNKIFGIAMYHSFYQDNICKNIIIEPTAETKLVMSRYGFLSKNNVNGISIFHATDIDAVNYFDHISNTEKDDYFRFYIKSNNPIFSLITVLPENWKGHIDYSSDHTDNIENIKNIILKETFSSKNQDNVLGTIKINFEDLKKCINNSDPLEYEINFTTIETQWHYYIINRTGIELTNPVIVEEGEIKFDGPENVNLPNGEAALLFSSKDRSIPMAETPKHKFDLMQMISNGEDNRSSSSYKLVIKNLPSPVPAKNTSIPGKTDSQQVSPIYIYI